MARPQQLACRGRELVASEVATAGARPAEVKSFVRYSERAADGGWIEKNGSYSFGMEDHPVVVRNARRAQIAFDTHGFTLVKHATDIDWTSREDFEARYYPQVRQLVQELTGADEVFAFMGIHRGGEDVKGGGPALSAHVDFNEPALRQWVARLAPERAEDLAGKRLVNINVWRGTRPVECHPLALCD